MATSTINSSTEDLSRALLVIGGGILIYEVVSRMVNKVAGKTLRAAAFLPIGATTVFMLNAAFMKMPKLQAQFITLCIFYVAASIVARILKANKESSSALSDFMVDMVQEAKDGAFFPRIGYEAAVEKVEVFMNLSKKSNAVLLAHPGVGKSTIPQTIAYKIAMGHYREESVFAGARLIHVAATDLIAGTIYRGMLEKRVQEMIRLAKKDPKIIYFIDEIHVLVGGESDKEHRFDISEMLKEAMADGGIRILGASTFDDHKKYIKPKVAFARRLSEVHVSEPTRTECFKMLKHSYALLRKDQLIKVSNRAIAAAILFSEGLTQKYFPDKAIEIIDFAVSKAEMKNPSPKNEIVVDVRQIAEAYIGCTNNEGRIDVEVLRTQFESFLEHKQHIFPGLV